jgi:hypothetical protein
MFYDQLSITKDKLRYISKTINSLFNFFFTLKLRNCYTLFLNLQIHGFI